MMYAVEPFEAVGRRILAAVAFGVKLALLLFAIVALFAVFGCTYTNCTFPTTRVYVQGDNSFADGRLTSSDKSTQGAVTSTPTTSPTLSIPAF